MARTVTYTLRADTDHFESGLKRSQTAAQDFFRALEKDADRFFAGQKNAGKALSSLGVDIGVFASAGTSAMKMVTAGVVAFGVAVVGTMAVSSKSLLDYSDKVVTLKERTGLGTTAIQVLGHMAQKGGTDVDSLAKAVVRMEVGLNSGNSAFKRLGLSISELKAMSPDAAFARVGSVIGSLPDPMQRAAAAVAIFGRAGADLLPVFAQDLELARQNADRLGLVLDGSLLTAAEAVGDTIDASAEAVSRFLERLAGVVIQSPAVIGAVDGIGSIFGSLSKSVDENAADLRKWANIAIVAITEVMASAATAAGMVVSIGKAGMFGWLVDLSGVEKVTDGLKKVTQSMQDAVLAKLRWQKIDMGGRGVLLPGGVLPPPGSGGGFADDVTARALEARRAAEQRFVTEDYQLWQRFYDDLRVLQWKSERDTLESVNRRTSDSIRSLDRASVGWLKDAANMIGEQDSALEVFNAPKITKLKTATLDWRAALQGITLVAGAIGGKFSDVVNVIGNIGHAFKDAKTGADQFYAIAAGVGQIGGIVGGKTGSTLQGAAGGAMSGFAIGGPVGAVIGGAIGGIAGLFGGSKKAKQEVAELKSQLAGLSDTAKTLGIDLTAAFASKSPAVLKAAIEQVNRAVEDQKRRLEGLSGFAGGLNEWSKSGVTDQASSDRAGRFAQFAFGSQVKETGDIFGALDSVAPTLERIAAASKEFGLEIPKGVASLLQLHGLDESIKSQVTGLNSMTKGIAASGMATQSLFTDLGTEAVSTRAKLEEAGLSGAQSLALMQPSLQQLYELQKRHGFAVDETTQALLDEAKAQGIVGDQFMSANERIVELLGVLIEAVGGQLPAAYRRAGDAAAEYSSRASNLPGPPDAGYWDPTRGGSSSGVPEGGDGFAGGTPFRNFGAGEWHRLHGEEAVLRRDQLNDVVSAVVSGRAASAPLKGSGMSVTFGQITIVANDAQGGRDAAAEFERLIVDGRILTLLQQRLGLRD